jgi:transcription elongation factor Elf1
MHRKHEQGKEPMRHNQIEEEHNHTQQLYENKEEFRCPVCDTILVVRKGEDIEKVQCGECHCVVGDYEHNKNTTELGEQGL